MSLLKVYAMNNKVTVLCTRELDEEYLQLALQHQIHIEIIPFIATVPIENIEVQQEIEAAMLRHTTVVFTSMNAVESVASFITDPVECWKIYCIGNSTRDLVTKYFGEDLIAGFSHDAASLAEIIIEDGETEELIFFCGNKRRPEMPEKLTNAGISVAEIVVYETLAVPQKIITQYEAILFFSPSAVESFFAENKIADHVVFFAIGSTTANAITQFACNKIIKATSPGKENLVEQMIEYFT